ncbi:aldose 1-epimerase family protein [Chachezhania antarctica]|mgnify:CR=1 FL=1|uniref:aldose 1-epimerase family protein n=1 Tax=Chachezhania antarctica TaxID=2340860 RepID=UPI000EB4F7F3|nr:aldose 1-epimerase family protein [Chachezhania antarctica]|tara:strand:- start:1330 stop:2508 length:1179 start_codon:yes stop_codon:yes gene_type:complete
MVKLYGKELSRHEAAALSGSLGHAAGVRLMELSDGLERGIRMLEFRTGSGLRFTVLVDRAMDIADCEHAGRAIGWHSPAGFRHPGLHEYEGEGGLGWLRSFSGLMVTCGLDHTLFMYDAPTESYVYGPRAVARQSLHGRVGTIPARLSGYGTRWEGDRAFLWAEGVVTQAAVFGEHLELTRRIEVEVGSDEIRMTDEVTNRGFYKTPHMYCYHINVGHPVLEDGARYIAPIRDVVWAAHADSYDGQGVGYRALPGPQTDFHEQVWQHEMGTDAEGEVPVALVNDRLGLGLMATTRKDQFPCLYEWQNLQAGQYALGIEPSTHHVLGNGAARDRGEMIWLTHGQSRRYDTRFTILPDADAIADAETRIAAIARQPEEDYPAPSGQFVPIGGRS